MSPWVNGIYREEKKRIHPSKRDWTAVENVDRDGKIQGLLVLDSNGDELDQEDVAWIRMALASTGQRPSSQVTIKDHFEVPILDAVTRTLKDHQEGREVELDISDERLAAVASNLSASIMRVLKKINMLSFLSRETTLIQDETRRCDHGYIICAPCDFIPSGMERELTDQALAANHQYVNIR